MGVYSSQHCEVCPSLYIYGDPRMTLDLLCARNATVKKSGVLCDRL